MSRIEDQANYYKNLHLRDRNIKAVIHIEDKEDEVFWNVQLQNLESGTYHFVSHSRSENGKETKGCEQCLRYRPYLNRQFFICIDSDLRLLRGEKGLTAENFIAQTYTYSWENHSCEVTHLCKRFTEKVSEYDFDFAAFLTELSEIVYLPLLMLVYYGSPDRNKKWNITRFNQCLPLQPSRRELAENGKPYLQKVRQLFDNQIQALDLPEDLSIRGITKDNAYLHIQGHRLYDLILHIGTMVCRSKKVAFRSEILDNNFPVSGYREIDCVKSDLRMILHETDSNLGETGRQR